MLECWEVANVYSHISPPQHTVRADMDRCTPTALGFVLAPFLMSSSQSSVRVGVGWVPTQHTLLPSALCMFERPNSTFAASRMHQISMREEARCLALLNSWVSLKYDDSQLPLF